MALPHMASVMNTNRVSTNIALHGTLLNTSLISCFVSFFCPAGGVIRSFVEKNTITRNINPMTANNDMVQSHPCDLSPPSENLLTKGNGQSLNHKLSYSGKYKTDRGYTCTFLYIGRHHTSQ